MLSGSVVGRLAARRVGRQCAARGMADLGGMKALAPLHLALLPLEALGVQPTLQCRVLLFVHRGGMPRLPLVLTRSVLLLASKPFHLAAEVERRVLEGRAELAHLHTVGGTVGGTAGAVGSWVGIVAGAVVRHFETRRREAQACHARGGARGGARG